MTDYRLAIRLSRDQLYSLVEKHPDKFIDEHKVWTVYELKYAMKEWRDKKWIDQPITYLDQLHDHLVGLDLDDVIDIHYDYDIDGSIYELGHAYNLTFYQSVESIIDIISKQKQTIGDHLLKLFPSLEKPEIIFCKF